jgi:4-amino-4-deoxy-L-arabinose transferase-like glycosyltransferase
MTTATPPSRPRPSLWEMPEVADVRPPAWFQRLPQRVVIAGVLFVLLAIAAYFHTRTLSGQFWFNEALATGIASHPLSDLLHVVHQSGGSPLYYVLLHFWIDLFGTGETATHVLSLALSLLCVPAAMWAAWSLFGRRAGIFAAILFAFSSYLARYAQDTQMYTLLVLLALFAVTGFLHAFIYRRRGYLILFVVSLALMLYTQGSAFLFAAGALVALIPAYRASEDRPGVLRDAAIAFGAVFVLYLPWLPTTIDQVLHATSPWHYAPQVGATVPSDLLGGERVDVTLLVATVVGLAALFTAPGRRTREWSAMWALIALALVGFVLARVGTPFTPSWVARYFGPLIAPLLLLAAFGSARARVVGVVAMVLVVAFLVHPSSFAPAYKSDMRDVAGEIGPLLHAGDLVVVGQPEQTSLAWYYLPVGLRYVNTAGAVSDPTYLNWSGALGRLQDARPQATLQPLVASLRPGQQLLYVRPLTEGVENWSAPWTQLVRRRSAQWGAILSSDVAAGTLKPVAWAPHNYRGSCCVANSAILYQKTSSP